ncbi:ParB/RepB/Spo0J family partition protein [Caldimonas tepidiphila]|uniref:ParB/RepB/Spo0J family partition protein n=1 Tax=Caldimonas tepidiphila TaxID=2315841 RepID=UPI000E5A5975|nr:ParB/RepB/Spo0J family partition protein [Caldimonas tepidiphila]
MEKHAKRAAKANSTKKQVFSPSKDRGSWRKNTLAANSSQAEENGPSLTIKNPSVLPGQFLDRTPLHQLSDVLTRVSQQQGPTLSNPEGINAVVELDTRRIVGTFLENRLPATYEGKEFSALKADIARTGGNTQPVLLRVEKPSLPGEKIFEIVTGHRRVRACQELGLYVKAIVLENVTDEELFRLMYYENTSHAPLRPIELGRMCMRAMDAGLYRSLRQLTQSVGLDLASVSRAIRLVQLPGELHETIRSPLQWQLKDADRLTQMLRDDGFLSRVRQVRERHGPLDREPLLRCLQNVGPTNTSVRMELTCGVEIVGWLRLDANHKVRVDLVDPVTDEQADELQVLLERLLARWMNNRPPPGA